MIEAPAAGSLAEALAGVPDPRRPYGWRPRHEPIPLVALLQLTVVALLCGARSQLAVAQWGREHLEDDPGLLEALGLPPGRSPCVATLHRVYKQLDVAAFEAALGAWLGADREPAEPPTTAQRGARGGRAVMGRCSEAASRSARTSRTACRGRIWSRRMRTLSGLVLGQVRAAGKGHELAAAKALLKPVPIAGRSSPLMPCSRNATSRSRSSPPVATTSSRSTVTSPRCSPMPRRPFPPWMRVERLATGLPTGVTTPPTLAPA